MLTTNETSTWWVESSYGASEALLVASSVLALLLCRRGRAFCLHFQMRMLRDIQGLSGPV